MWNKIKPYLIGFVIGILGVISFILGSKSRRYEARIENNIRREHDLEERVDYSRSEVFRIRDRIAKDRQRINKIKDRSTDTDRLVRELKERNGI